MAPVVAVPTTAGTGSEVGRASVITDLRDHTKKIIFHPKMMPGIVLEDPELTVGLPPHITAAVGMDALSHNLEAYCAPGYHPMAEGIAVEGMRLIKEYLPRAVANGADIEARAQMLVASSMGATAFQKGLGAMHSLSHPCSANLNTHHGLTNAVVMPYVLEWNREVLDAKLSRLAAWLGLPEHSRPACCSGSSSCAGRSGFRPRSRASACSEEHAKPFAPQAFNDPSTGGNPVPMTSRLRKTVLAVHQRRTAGRVKRLQFFRVAMDTIDRPPCERAFRATSWVRRARVTLRDGLDGGHRQVSDITTRREVLFHRGRLGVGSRLALSVLATAVKFSG